MTVRVRSIEADELDRWGSLGGEDVVDLARSFQDDRSSDPRRWLVAERDGTPTGRLGLFAGSAGCGSDRVEHHVFGLWTAGGDVAERESIGHSLLRAALRRLPAGLSTIDVRTNPERHDDIELRRGLLAPLGGRQYQEKVGLLWKHDDPAGPSPDPAGFRTVPIERFGKDEFAWLMGRCQAGTLDRNDRFYLGLCGPDAWGRQMLDYYDPRDAGGWLVGVDGSGEPIGYVILGAFEPPETSTIVHIGVVPDARGRGHVARLLAAANDLARLRGVEGILSDVDLENAPMLAAMERAGHRPGRRPWHVWHDRLSAVVSADRTPITLRDLDHTDRDALMRLERKPGQERYLGSMESHFEDAIADARAEPRMWGLHADDEVVGFVMISDGIPAERLATDDDLVGPYYLWRLLVDARHQGRGFGRAAIDLVCDYLSTRPGADALWTSCEPGDGSPQPFYLDYGFERTGEVKWGEDLLRLDLPRG